MICPKADEEKGFMWSIGREGAAYFMTLWGRALHSDVILMQYTGLKDKNGKDIYESDVVVLKSNRHKLIVEYRRGCYELVHQYKDLKGNIIDEYCQPIDGMVTEDALQVIGNIYENPELIKTYD